MNFFEFIYNHTTKYSIYRYPSIDNIFCILCKECFRRNICRSYNSENDVIGCSNIDYDELLKSFIFSNMDSFILGIMI